MNIIIQYDYPCPYLAAISRAMSAIGHNVVWWNSQQKTIYEMIHQMKPELLIVYENLPPNSLKAIEDIPHIIYGDTDINGKALGTIEVYNGNKNSFVDVFNYTPKMTNSSFETDILLSSNYYRGGSDLMMVMDNIFNNTKFTLKLTGRLAIPSVFFIGTTTEEEFINIAKAAQGVVTTTSIERDSLLYHKIYAVTVNEVNDEFYKMIREPKLRNKFVKQERKKLLDANKTSIHTAMELCSKLNRDDDVNKLKELAEKVLV